MLQWGALRSQREGPGRSTDPRGDRSASMGRVAFATRRVGEARVGHLPDAASMGRVAFATRRIDGSDPALRFSELQWGALRSQREGLERLLGCGEPVPRFNGARCVRNAKVWPVGQVGDAGAASMGRVAFATRRCFSPTTAGRIGRLQWGALRSQREGWCHCWSSWHWHCFNGARCVRNAKVRDPRPVPHVPHRFNGARCVRNAKASRWRDRGR